MIQINEKDGRLSAWGSQGDAKEIRWTKTPIIFPESDEDLDLTGAEITCYYTNGTTMDVTQFCTFIPGQGSHIQPDEKYITVTAYYVAKSGKVLSAAITLPVVHPIWIRIVTAQDYIPVEQYYCADSDKFIADQMPLDKRKFGTYAYYVSGDVNDIVEGFYYEGGFYSDPDHQWAIQGQSRKIYFDIATEYNYVWNGEEFIRVATAVYTKQVEPQYSSNTYNNIGGGYGWVYGIRGHENQKENVTVYHKLFEPSIESFEYAVELTASIRLSGVNFTATTYIESIPIEYLYYIGFPTTTGEATITKDRIQFFYLRGGPNDGPFLYTPVPGLEDMWLYFSKNPPSVFNVHDSLTIDFQNGMEGSIWLVRSSPETSGPRFESSQFDYKCTGGHITWTMHEEES